MTITIGQDTLHVADVIRVARENEQVSLDPAARSQMATARSAVEHLMSAGPALYGVNSALGPNAGEKLDADDLGAYQRRAVQARSVAVGPACDRETTRAALFARLAGLARGGSGISLPVFDATLALLNHGVHPCMPRHGSIGVTDMPLLAHLALVLLGEGQAEHEGTVLPGAEALQRAGLSPVTLGAKDGLSLFSSNAVAVGRSSLVLHDLQRLLDSWLVAVALSHEAFRANVSALNVRVAAARPAAGQEEVAARLRHLLRASALFAPDAARRLQDPLSLRVVPQVHGSTHWMVSQAVQQLEIELNSRADSPLVVTDRQTLLSNGNFHVPALALTLDSCAIALAQVSSLGSGRCQRFMNPALTDLPLQLTRHGPAHSGFGPLQKTMSSLWSDIRMRANPASLDFLVVSEGVEDHACMALHCAEKLGEQVERARYLVAIELIIAAQAIDLRGTNIATMGAGPRASYAKLRAMVPMLDQDRALGPDVEWVNRALIDGEFATGE